MGIFTTGAQPAQTNAGGFARCASTARVLGIKCSRNGDKSSSAEIPNNATAPCAAKRRARRSAARPAVESQQVILPELEAADLLAITHPSSAGEPSCATPRRCG